jgi:hypothetical protein
MREGFEAPGGAEHNDQEHGEEPNSSEALRADALIPTQQLCELIEKQMALAQANHDQQMALMQRQVDLLQQNVGQSHEGSRQAVENPLRVHDE